MPFQGDELYRTQDQILASMIAGFQAAIPDVWLGEDGNLRLMIEIEAGQIEGVYVANQLLLEDVFVPSANLVALERHGDQFGLTRKIGTVSNGNLLFTGQGGTYIGIGAEVSYDPGGGSDPLFFVTTLDGTIPNPGIPSAPVATDHGAAGALAAGTYEWVITFVTPQGETIASAVSNALVLAINHSADVTLPLGGPGTTARNLYRNVNGGVFQRVAVIADNTTLTINDNNAAPGVQVPPTVDTSTRISLPAQSEDTGLSFNAVPGSITVLSNVPDGITDVTNPAAFTGGSDEEDTDTYRTRILNALRSPASGAPGDLKSWAEAVAGVESATVFPNDNLGTPTNGHVTVRVSGPNGSIPPTSVTDAVAAALAQQDLANITIHVTTFTQSALNVTATVTAAATYSHADIVPNVTLAIQNYIASVPVGGTVYISGIIQHVREVVGVADVTVSLPATNQTAAATTKFIPGAISVL